MDNPQANNQTASNPLSTIRRVIWYALRTVLIVSAVLGLCYAVFTEAMYLSNIYIVVTEGMPLRAEAILRDGSVSELHQYFTEEQILGDAMLYSGDYSGFTVENYDYRYDIGGFKVRPWSKNASLTYVERIPTINATPESEAEETEVPAWTAVRYKISVEKRDGRWLISDLTVLELDPQEEVLPTPDYSQLEGKEG